MKRELHSELIAKYFNGTASEADLIVISEWVKEDPSHERHLAQMQKVWSHRPINKSSFDTEKAWQKVATKTIDAKKPQYGNTLKIAASIAAIFAIGSLAWVLFSKSDPEMLSYQTTNESKEVILPDGSKVTLNSYSSVQFPEKFSGEVRSVSMIGEAFFDVTKNPEKPFIIDINTTEVTVLGTSFNINSRDSATIVSVKTGKVKFGKKQGKKVDLIKNQEAKFIVNKDSLTPVVTVNPNVFAFKTQVFYFENTPLKEVASQLSKAYHTSVLLEEKNWGNYNLTATFERQNLETVLEVVAETLSISIQKEEDGFLIKKKANVQ